MVSVVIPVYINSDEILDLLSDCVASLKDYDELILQFDKTGEGFAKTVNKGIKRAKGDYIALINDDTKLLQGSLKDMCRYGRVVRAKLLEGDLAKFSFVMIHRSVFDKIGLLDEEFKVGFYEDDDFLARCKDAGIEVVDLENVVAWHGGGMTIKNIKDRSFEEHNKKLYEDKCNLRHQ